MSYLDLETEIKYLKGVGPKIAEKLHKLGIFSYRDLLEFFPRKYFDYSNVTSIENVSNRFSLNSNDEVTIRGDIVGIANKTTSRRNFKVTEAVVEDGTGSIKVVWFNQSFLTKMLPAGTEVILNGKIRYDHFSHGLVMESPQRSKSAKIVPIYPETEGLHSAYLRRLVEKLMPKIDEIAEFLPDEITKKYQLLSIQKAIASLHNPNNNDDIKSGRRRMAFDELFFIALQSNLSKEELKQEKSQGLKIDDEELKRFTASLPFDLTKDQRIAAWKIIQEIGGERPMNRLLNGDVGSGKTVVAAFAAYVTVLAGFKVALMAPTEILAVQHYETFKKLLEPFDIKIGLFTGSTKVKGEKEKGERTDDIYIGTQALLHLKKPIDNLGLVIIDEQHRFGVAQRAQLLKGEERRPHFLSMTATPIPRTFQLALFGDLDVSIIKTMPAGRKPIKTKLVTEDRRDAAYKFIRDQVKSGRQAFVIVPLIEESEESLKSKDKEGTIAFDIFETERKTVIAEYEKLSKEIFPELKIGMLHGRMKGKDKNEVMNKFSSAEHDILVSTSVVEVGVDIPNATVMMIEDAERFGLAQLHQFRGRVGRAEHQSFCLLFTNSRSKKAQERLVSFENTLDGFELAQKDLETRGPGQIFGTMQSGDFNLKMASFSDLETITQASEAAKELVSNSPELTEYPNLKEKLSDYINSKHFE